METSRLQTLIFLAAVCATAGFAPAADAPRGRPIEYSEPRSERTNSNPAGVMRSSLLDQLEDGFAKPFNTLKPGDSLSGMVLPAPQQSPIVPSSHRPRPANKRSDNYLLPPEELYLSSSLEENFKPVQLTEDGRNVKSLSPTERALRDSYDRARSPILTNQSGLGSGRIGLLGGNPLLSPAQASSLQRALGMESDSTGSKLREMRDALDSREMFGLGNGFGGPKMTPSELMRRDQMMQLYNPNYTPRTPGTLASPGGFSTPYVDSSFYDPPKPTPAAPALAPVVVSPPSVGFAPAFAPPPEPERPAAVLAPATPFMGVPRRNF
jgi:hypothetical protein